MTYNKTTWENRVPPRITAANLNKIEIGIEDAHDMATGRCATLVVAANGSSALSKQQADYVCDGTDDQVEIQAAIDALPAEGGKIEFMEGTYNPSASVNGISNLTLKLGQATFNWTTENPLFLFTGTSSDETTLTVDAVLDDATITVADASGLSEGDYILIYSTHLSGSDSIKDGEIHQIKSIAGNVITLVGEIWESYGYAQVDTTTVGLIDPITNVRIEGGKIEGNSFDTGDITAITFFYGIDIILKNISTYKIPSTAIALYSTINSTITGSHIYGSAKGGAGYGVSFAAACSGILIDGNFIKYCRHGISSGGLSAYPGTPKNCMVSNNNIYDATSVVIDAHEYGDNLIYVSNVVKGVNGAFNIGCKKSIIQNNIINGGIGDRGNYIEEITISGNTICNGTIYLNSTGLKKIIVRENDTDKGTNGSSIVGADVVYVENNIFDDKSAEGVRIDDATEAYIRNNTIRNIDGHGIEIKSVGRCMISGNILENPNRVAWGTGILVDTGCTTVDIEHNKIYATTTNAGIYIQTCPDPKVRWNVVDVSGGTWLTDNSGVALYFESCSDLFMDVLAVSATHVRSNEDLSAATPITFTVDAQPDVPRTLSWSFDSHAQITEYDMEVIGVDAKGRTVTETWDEGDGWSGETNNAFATITSIKMTSRTGTGAADTMDIGITDVLGLSNVIYATSDVFKIKKNNANATVATAQMNTIYGTYDMSVIGLAATDDFTIWYKSNLNIIS